MQINGAHSYKSAAFLVNATCRNRNRSHSGSHRVFIRDLTAICNAHTTALAGARPFGLLFGEKHLGNSPVTRRVYVGASCGWLHLLSVAWLLRCVASPLHLLLGSHGCTTQDRPCTRSRCTLDSAISSLALPPSLASPSVTSALCVLSSSSKRRMLIDFCRAMTKEAMSQSWCHP